jgi:hypothetical protein
LVFVAPSFDFVALEFEIVAVGFDFVAGARLQNNSM